MTVNSTTTKITDKKVWEKPDFQILSYGNDINAKNNFATRESHLHGSGAYYYFSGKTLGTAIHVGPKNSFHS